MAQLHRRVREVPHRPLRGRFGVFPPSARRAVVALTLAALALAGGRASAQDDDGGNERQLEEWLEQVASDDASMRESAYAALGTLGPEYIPALSARAERVHLGRPERRWATDILTRFRTRGRIVDERTGAMVRIDTARGALLELGQRHRATERGMVRKMAEVALLWRALDAIGTLDARRAVFPLVAADGGLWMPEARNWVRERGTDLLAVCLYARRADQPNTRRWGAWASDELGADDPGRAIPALPEEQIGDVLRAYGTLHVQSAMRVIVSYLGHPRRDVRTAARWAIDEYGGNAIWVLRTAYRNGTGEHAPAEWAAGRVSEALVAHLDEQRLAPVRAALDEGRAAADAGDLETMRARYDDVLARVVEPGEGDTVASGYARWAEVAEARGDVDGARAALLRAARVAPESPARSTWERHAELLRTERMRASGVYDEAHYMASVGDPRARDVLAAQSAEPHSILSDPSGGRSNALLLAALVLSLLGATLSFAPRVWRGARSLVGPSETSIATTPSVEETPADSDPAWELAGGERTLDDGFDVTLADSTAPGY
ncbi:MAG: hypothetical protein AB7S26_08095 [Sandaracinaceae bacterium]